MTEIPTDLKPLVLQGHVVDKLRELPPDSVQCVVTSPPYFGLRLYGTPPQTWGGDPSHEHEWTPTMPRRKRKAADATSETEQRSVGGRNYDAIGGEACPCGAWRGEMGLEPTPDLFVDHLAGVFDEVRRVLRPDGVVFLNLGDTFSTHPVGLTGAKRWKASTLSNRDETGAEQAGAMDKRSSGLPEKSLIGIPWRVAFELQRRGWILRSDVVWAKPNCMPESARDRPTRSHEYVFLLTRGPRYFYDQDAVRNTYAQSTMPEIGEKYRGTAAKPYREYGAQDASDAHRSMIRSLDRHVGSNLRDVWWISPQPFLEAHFATFPEDLVETCLRLGTSERGCCSSCGTPWRRVTRTSYVKSPVHGPGSNISGRKDVEHTDDHMLGGKANKGSLADLPRVAKQVETTGWESQCDCDPGGTTPCIALDPFAGSGTVSAVARRLGLRSVGIELNADYVAMAERRVAEVVARVTPNAGYQRRLAEFAEAT